MDQALVAAHEAHAPARHAVALGQAEELHPHVFGARDLEEAGGLVVVEDQVGVGEIVDHQHVVRLANCHDALEKFQVHAPWWWGCGETK